MALLAAGALYAAGDECLPGANTAESTAFTSPTRPGIPCGRQRRLRGAGANVEIGQLWYIGAGYERLFAGSGENDAADGGIGLGTQFRAEVVSGGKPLSMVIEFISFERPHRLGSRTTMPGMVILGELTFEAVGDATRMHWAWDIRPTGAMRLLKPLITLMGRRQEREIWTSLKRCLEA